MCVPLWFSETTLLFQLTSTSLLRTSMTPMRYALLLSHHRPQRALHSQGRRPVIFSAAQIELISIISRV